MQSFYNKSLMWPTESVKQSLIEQLENNGFAVVDSFLAESLFFNLQHRLENLVKQNALKKAGLGHQGKLSSQDLLKIRGDFTAWIDDPSEDATENDFLIKLYELSQFLNESFYLGVRRWEAHFAVYPPGGFYETHVDQPQGKRDRIMTFVYYLNPSDSQSQPWLDGDGGELMIYNFNLELLKKVLPRGNRLVLFKSDLFPHEVKPANRERKSLTGWFRSDV